MSTDETYQNPHDFNKLCLPCYDELVAFTKRRTMSLAKAEDVVQDSYVRAWNAWSRWVPQGDPVIWARAWMYRIVTNVFKMEYVRDKKYDSFVGHWMRPQVDPDERDQSGIRYTDCHLAVTDQVASALHQGLDSTHPYYEMNGLGDEVREALERINQEWALVVQMVYIDCISETEVAKILDLPPGTVRSRMARGRLALARILSPYARQRFGFGPESLIARRADEALDSLEPVQELEPDPDGVDCVMTDDEILTLDQTEPRPDAHTAW